MKWNVQGGPKNWHTFLYALTSSNIDRFSNLYQCLNQENICNNTVTKDHTTPQVCRYTTLWNVKCLKSNNWKQDDFCNNTLKKIYNRQQRVYCLKVTVASCSFTSNVQCVRLAAGRRTLRMCCYRSVVTHLRCGGIFIDSIITNGLLILTMKKVWKSVNIWRS